MNKVLIGFLLALSLLGCFLSSVYAFVGLGMSDPADELVQWLFRGLIIGIPVVLAGISLYLIALLRRTPNQPTAGKNHIKMFLIIAALVLFFGIFGLASLGTLSVFFG